MKRAAAVVVVGVLLASASTQAAFAAWWGQWVVGRSATCLTAWDHIDMFGRPYGSRQVRCSGQTFPTTVDWDMVCWPAGYYLRWEYLSYPVGGTDRTADHCRKINTYSFIELASVRN